jgi:hypothetical protein
MRIYQQIITTVISCLGLAVTNSSCKKLVEIPGPISTISTPQVFNTESQANGAMAGIYTVMINGTSSALISDIWQRSFAAGLSTALGSLSSDEMYVYAGVQWPSWYYPNTNKLTRFTNDKVNGIWTSAYTAIYGANSVVEGIAASTSTTLKDSVKKALTGEAKYVRSLCYFYLTNFFGDVPLVLTTDFNKTANMSRTPQAQIYQQMILDLKEASTTMSEGYPTTSGERVRPNRYAAAALLARVSLYTGSYADAVAAATTVINNNAVYALESDLNNVFLSTSKEAIWELKPTGQGTGIGNATPEGYGLGVGASGNSGFCLTDDLVRTFEPGDKRLAAWTANFKGAGNTPVYYASKYKIGSTNSSVSFPLEYYVVQRLAEMYLVRAEAAANGGPGGLTAAIADLNVIRNRAGLSALPATLGKDQVLAAVVKERRTELFSEWGHRWFDLKRTGKAHDVLSTIPLKQPWLGDYQLLYPIPTVELDVNHFLTQNPGY